MAKKVKACTLYVYAHGWQLHSLPLNCYYCVLEILCIKSMHALKSTCSLATVKLQYLSRKLLLLLDHVDSCCTPEKGHNPPSYVTLTEMHLCQLLWIVWESLRYRLNLPVSHNINYTLHYYFTQFFALCEENIEVSIQSLNFSAVEHAKLHYKQPKTTWQLNVMKS